jgi:hypothetical protein
MKLSQFGAILIPLLLSINPSFSGELVGVNPRSATSSRSRSGEIRIAQACCKTCHKGKACGDSCIAKDRRCHQPPGCACDAE